MTHKEWLSRHEESITKHDREIVAIITLIKTGMKMIVETQRQQAENAKQIAKLSNMMEKRFSNGQGKV